MSATATFIKDSEMAKTLVNFSTTSKNFVQNLAGAVYKDIDKGIIKTEDQFKMAWNTLNDISHKSAGEIANSIKGDVKDGVQYFIDKPFNEIGQDLSNTGMGKNMRNAANWTRNKGGSLLGDADNFLHNADGSYNRWKVGGAIGAGLGIAGIIGYNANN